MALTLREIRENTAAARALMERARKEKFAIGAFNLENQETLKAIARAAVTKKSPVLVEVGHDDVKSIGIENIRDMVDNYRRELDIEIYLNLDHSPSLEAAIEGIENGFEFIHLDILQSNPAATIEEIIDQTKYIVSYARLTGALIESEPSYYNPKASTSEGVNYDEIKKTFTTPEAAVEFVKNTGIDIFAPAIGNLHEDYPAPKVLDLDLLKKIRETADLYISLHGGSGTPEHYFKDAIEIGVSKINVNSDIRAEFRASLEKVLKKNPNEVSLANLMDEVVSAVQRLAEEKIDIFGSAGKSG